MISILQKYISSGLQKTKEQFAKKIEIKLIL